MEKIKTRSICSLVEDDYLSLFKIIERLVHCRTHADLMDLLKIDLLELLNASSCFFCFTDPVFTNVQILDAVNIPANTFPALEQLIQFDPLGPHIIENSRPVMAYDVDFPRHEAHSILKQFFQQHPEYKEAKKQYWCRFASSIGVLNLPDVTTGLGVHRLLPNNDPFTIREVRILELLRPSLMQTIRSIILSKALDQYQAFAHHLADIDLPVALISTDWLLIYCNDAFTKLSPTFNCKSLSPDLIKRLKQEVARLMHSSLEANFMEVAFYHIEKRTYRITLTQINTASLNEWYWLLRMERNVDGYAKMICILQKATLTSREIEVCVLIRNGFDTQTIADRLCISYNTVRSHLRKIHISLQVKSRSQLIAHLNQLNEA